MSVRSWCAVVSVEQGVQDAPDLAICDGFKVERS
jgi:hypothetical protein